MAGWNTPARNAAIHKRPCDPGLWSPVRREIIGREDVGRLYGLRRAVGQVWTFRECLGQARKAIPAVSTAPVAEGRRGISAPTVAPL
jgi:hypothetical protein